ncbi:hypothetical protein BIW11_01972 [Tropilaelaps mercedesae]|uniref:NFX1-type zinc finger-containing protein 1-like n=1 Tax=Tropilaelaps mercedesae TaxID=418985 RepID=A0A1V9X5Q6_9ACAR|nr:hypothetical protein BIW11_01972 [Tropilaelaps mercedesae]
MNCEAETRQGGSAQISPIGSSAYQQESDPIKTVSPECYQDSYLQAPKTLSRSRSDSHMEQGTLNADNLDLATALASSTPYHKNQAAQATEYQHLSRITMDTDQFRVNLHPHIAGSLHCPRQYRVPRQPHNLRGPDSNLANQAAPQISFTSLLTDVSSTANRARSAMMPSKAFSPRSCRAIVNSAQAHGEPRAEPICLGGYLASCTASCSILELSKAVWKLSTQSSKFEGLDVGDRVLVEFQGGLSFEEGTGVDILEAAVLLQSKDSTVVIIGHEKVTFSLVGGSIPVRLFLVKRTFFERKFHSVSTTGQYGVAGLKIACTMKVVQGPPRSEKMTHIMKDIESTVARHSRVLVIGEAVRERMDPVPSWCLLNLNNLRYSSRKPQQMSESGECETRSSMEQLLREQHCEVRQQIDDLVGNITTLCDDYGEIVRLNESKMAKNQELQDALTRLEALKELIDQNDRRLANEIYQDIQFIYGTVDDVQKSLSLVNYLEPAASIILDADCLALHELDTIFSVCRNHVYLSIDTPFFWQRVKEWKIKGVPNVLFRRRNLVSEEFLARLEQFITPEMLSVECFPGVLSEANKGLGLLFSCFKHTLDPLPEVPTHNIVVIKHSQRGEAAAKFESDLMASIRKLFIMAGEVDHSAYSGMALRLPERFSILQQNSIVRCTQAFAISVRAFIVPEGRVASKGQNGALDEWTSMQSLQYAKRVYKHHADTFVSLHGLTATALPSLYGLFYFTARRVYLIGNLRQLKKADEYVRRFVNNLQSSGFVRKSLILTCPKHKCDVILGEGSGIAGVGWQIGCQEMCSVTLPCGHPCPLKCHVHDEQTFDEEPEPCRQKCLKYLPCRHRCPFVCGKPCAERCSELVEITLDCGHLKLIPCSHQGGSDLHLIMCNRSKCQRDFDYFPDSTSLHRRPNLISRLLGTS